MGQAGHSVSEALAELVDNSIDARLPGHPVDVQIELDVPGGMVRVQDNGAGMNSSQLAGALVLAESHKNGDSIGRFGLGLKTACASLGMRFTITSATQPARFAHIAHYDAEQFLAEGVWRLPIRRKSKRWEHGTVIEIASERLYPSLSGTLARNLGVTFRHFLLDGVLRLSINEEQVDAADYDVDPETVMPLQGKVAGRRVSGWSGLLRRSSQRGWYGFALIRHRRIVRKHEKLGFQAHPQTARVVGELHLDGFDTNNLKTDFIRETETWRKLEAWVSEAIEPTLAASRKLAHAGMLDMKIRSQIAAQRNGGEQDDGLHLPDGLLVSDERSSEPVVVTVGPVHLNHVFAIADPDAPYLEVEQVSREGEADLMLVRTNLAHPAASQVSDRSGWACHNIAEVAANQLSRASDQLQLNGVILAKLLADRPLRRALQSSAKALSPQRAGAR